MQQLTTLSKRIDSIDILRGFSLLGIVLVHMVEQYYAGQPPAIITSQEVSIPDMIAQGFVGMFIIGKFYMIFSLLFGLSFFIQFSKQGDTSFLIRFAWRLIILFAIGMLHHLHYRGDILSIYAILGFGLILFYRLPDKALLVIALILIFNVPSFVVRFIQLFLPGESPMSGGAPDQLQAYYDTIKNGTYFEILSANLREFIGKMMFQFISGRIFITFGLFLLGVYIGRKGIFSNLEEHVTLIRKARRAGLYIIGGAVVAGGGLVGALAGLGLLNDKIAFLAGGFAFDAFNTGLALLYVTMILLLLQKEKWYRRLHVFYPVGRMGLTTYLMQTAIGVFIMFSFGLGLAFELGALWSLLIGLLVFVFQIWFAHTWFRYFEYGPVEWLWRMLTYLKPVQIMRYRLPEVS